MFEKSLFRFVAFIAVALLTCVGAAEAELIDFEALYAEDNVAHPLGSSYTEDGYTLTPVGEFANFRYHGTLHYAYAGSPSIYRTTSGTIVLTKADAGAFDLLSISLAELTNNFSGATVTFTGNMVGGSQVSQGFTLNGIRYDLETFAFSGFTNLLSVEWTQGNAFTGHQFDNVSVQGVPEPSTFAALLAMGVMGLVGWRWRKRRAA